MLGFSRSRLIIVGLLVVGIIIVVIASLSGNNGNTTDMSKSYPVPDAFATAVPYGKDTLLMSNSRFFVAYNYVTGSSKALSDDNTTPDLSNVDQIMTSPNKRYIVFHMTIANEQSYFDKTLTAQGLDSGNAYWWVYDTQAKTYRHLPVEVTSVVIKNDKLYALDGNDNQAITTYSLPDISKTAAINVSDVDTFFVVKDGFIVENNDLQQALFTKDGTVSTVLFKNGRVTYITADGTKAIGLASNKDQQNLYQYDLQTKTQTLIDTNVSNQFAWDPSGKIAYRRDKDANADQPIFHVYNLATQKDQTVTATADGMAKKSVQPTVFLGDTSFIATDNSGNSYLVGTALHAMRSQTGYDFTITVNGQDVDIAYYTDPTAFLVTLGETDTVAQRQAVYNQLKKSGFNPDILDIRFTLFTPPAQTL